MESTFPADKAGLYTGAEAATVHPVDQATQALYYEQALELAFCQPNVQAFLVFSLIDENALPGWQSGVYYADGTPKSSLAAVQGRRRPRPPQPGRVPGPPGHAAARPALVPARTADCPGEHVPDLAHVRRRLLLSRPDRARGNARDDALGERPRDRPRADDGRVPPDSAAAGSYRITVWARATANVGPPATAASPVFVVRRL